MTVFRRHLTKRVSFGRLDLHRFGRALQSGKGGEVPFITVGRVVIFLDVKS